MLDFDRLLAGLGKLDRGEARHLMRHLADLTGAPPCGVYDPVLAESAFTRLTTEEQEAVRSYVRLLFSEETIEADRGSFGTALAGR